MIFKGDTHKKPWKTHKKTSTEGEFFSGMAIQFLMIRDKVASKSRPQPPKLGVVTAAMLVFFFAGPCSKLVNKFLT